MSEEGGTTTVAPRAVDVGAIERELDALLFEPQPDSDERQPVGIRARMSNLLIYVPTQAAAARIGEAVGAIAEHHPSRILMLVAESGGEQLDAHVSAVCHLGEGRRQVCSEHVTVSSAAGTARRLPSIARSLLIADLPTSLWWAAPTPPPLAGDVFDELRAMSVQVLYDSSSFADGLRGLEATADWVAGLGRGVAIGDLAWSRLAGWRALFAQALDPSAAPGALEAMRELTIEYGEGGLVQAALLAGWLAERLGWQPVPGRARPASPEQAIWTMAGAGGEVRVDARPAGGSPPRSLARVSVAWQAGAGREERTLAALDEARLSVLRADGTPCRVLASPKRDLGQLVARELPERAGDRGYRRALATARGLARGVAMARGTE